MAYTDIICMDTGEKLQRVTRIDIEQGIVWRHHVPLRQSLSNPEALDEYPTRFASIYPIYAGAFRPYLVHCYGRMN